MQGTFPELISLLVIGDLHPTVAWLGVCAGLYHIWGKSELGRAMQYVNRVDSLQNTTSLSNRSNQLKKQAKWAHYCRYVKGGHGGV